MFERLIDLLLGFYEQVIPFVVVAQYEDGVILRLGIFHRRAHAGLNFKIPFVEDVLTTENVTTTMDLTPQTLTTADHKPVVVTAIVKYRIKDVKLFLLEIYDSIDVINDVVQGNVRRVVSAIQANQINDTNIEKDVLTYSRRDISKYGVYIEKVTFRDAAKVKSLRLITDA